MLHPLVQFIFHFVPTRIRQDAAIPEGAGPKFRTALEPSKYMALGQQFCRIPAYIVAGSVYRLQTNKPVLRRRARILIRVWSPMIGVFHGGRAVSFQNCQIAVVSTTNRNAIIARRRLNPYVVIAGLAHDPAVGHAIESNATGHAQVFGASCFTQPDGAL